jgi:quinol-cytochrome oxidoreductase complex cytochrome b subunit/mono/diheme cytochrome c family protein
MLTRLREWIDHRTGLGPFIDAMLLEHVPGGARWRYVWGSTLAFVFTIQLVTGTLLMTAYSPGDSTAWASVHFIQYQMDFGWLIRGLHHFGSQAMVVLMGLHMLQVVIAGAHLPPREFNWWIGLGLMGAVLGLSLTGYLLPWDQKGYWATQVATNIAGGVPVVGPFIQKVVVGGSEYGNHTLTRFFGLHVAILPAIVIGLLIAHIAVFRRHGITTPSYAVGEGWFWPDQMFKDMVACLIVFGVMLTLVVTGYGNKVESPAPVAAASEAEAPRSLYDKLAHAGRDGCGANLDAPADPDKPYPARPEWYFLFLFQLLKYFEGPNVLVGTLFIPGGVGLILFLLPLIGGGKLRPIGHSIGVVVVVCLLTSAGALTLLALGEDAVYPTSRALLNRLGTNMLPLISLVFVLMLAIINVLGVGGFRNAVKTIGMTLVLLAVAATGALTYLAMDADSKYRAFRAAEPTATDTTPFDGHRIPAQVVAFIQSKMTDADKVPLEKTVKFREEMKHSEELAERAMNLAMAGVPAEGGRYLLRNDPMTRGKDLFVIHCASCHDDTSRFKANPNATASDLAGFGSADWVLNLLKDPSDAKFFGRTKLKEMTGWVRRERDKAKKAGKEAALDKDFADVSNWLGTHPRGDLQAEQDKHPGAKVFADKCMECHSYRQPIGEATKGPDFTGYGDAEWLRMMIMSPDHPFRYGANNTMPAFRDLQRPDAGVMRMDLGEREGKVKIIDLNDIERELIIRFLSSDNRVIFGGQPISGPPKK